MEVSFQIDGREVLYEKGDFDVTHQAAIARPWIYSKIMSGRSNPVLSYMIGSQLYNKGRLDEARTYLEQANRSNPESIVFALNLARLYMNMKDFKLVEQLLQPFLDKPEPPEYEVYFILGRAYQSLSLLDKAIETFDTAIDKFGVNTSLLNAVGECYFQLGRYEEALVTWERSLEINPNQPELKKSVEAIKERKNV